MPKLKPIVTNQDNIDVPLELIAEEIVKVADAFKSIQNSRLKQRAVVLLIKDKTGYSMETISSVLAAASELKAWLK